MNINTEYLADQIYSCDDAKEFEQLVLDNREIYSDWRGHILPMLRDRGIKLKDLTEIELGTVNLADLKAETNTLHFDIVLPEGVTNMTGETQVTAVITFPQLGTKKLTINKTQFRKAGVPEDAEVLWISEMVDVELRGPKDLIKSITEEDVIVTVDFTGEEPGTVSKVPQITFGDNYSGVGAMSATQITVALQLEVPDATAG